MAGLLSEPTFSTPASLSDDMTRRVYQSAAEQAEESDSLQRETDSLWLDSLWLDIPLAVDEALGGYRLDRFLAERIRRLSRTRIQTIIAAGHVRRTGGLTLPLRAATRVRAGDTIIVRRPAPYEPPAPMHAGVIHRCADLLVLDKPGGLPVHPSARYHRHTLTAVLRRDLGAAHGWRMAHRLDRETSGVIVFGQKGTSDSLLKRAFQERRVHKEYCALVRGTLRAAAAIDIPLGPAIGSRIRIKIGPRPLALGGLAASTEVEPLLHGEFRAEPITLVRAFPRTGRQHQIRVHLAELGHPVLGDKLYGIDEQAFLDVADHVRLMADLEAELGLARHALHSASLRVPHPRDGRDVEFRAPWPADLAAILEHPRVEAARCPPSEPRATSCGRRGPRP